MAYGTPLGRYMEGGISCSIELCWRKAFLWFRVFSDADGLDS